MRVISSFCSALIMGLEILYWRRHGTLLQDVCFALGRRLRGGRGALRAAPRFLLPLARRLLALPRRAVEARDLRARRRADHARRALYGRPDLGSRRRLLHVGPLLRDCAMGGRYLVRPRTAGCDVRRAVRLALLGELVLRPLPRA